MRATIRGGHVVDLITRDRRPYAVHFNLIVAIDHACGWPRHARRSRPIWTGSARCLPAAPRTGFAPAPRWRRTSALRAHFQKRSASSVLPNGARRSAAENRGELAPLELIELHSYPWLQRQHIMAAVIRSPRRRARAAGTSRPVDIKSVSRLRKKSPLERLTGAFRRLSQVSDMARVVGSVV